MVMYFYTSPIQFISRTTNKTDHFVLVQAVLERLDIEGEEVVHCWHMVSSDQQKKEMPEHLSLKQSAWMLSLVPAGC